MSFHRLVKRNSRVNLSRKSPKIQMAARRSHLRIPFLISRIPAYAEIRARTAFPFYSPRFSSTFFNCLWGLLPALHGSAHFCAGLRRKRLSKGMVICPRSLRTFPALVPRSPALPCGTHSRTAFRGVFLTVIVVALPSA